MAERLILIYTFENDFLEFKAGWKNLCSGKMFDFIDADMSIEKVLSLIKAYFESKCFECFIQDNCIKTEDETILCAYEASPEVFKIFCQENIVPQKDGSLEPVEKIIKAGCIREMKSGDADFVCTHFKYKVNGKIVDAYMYVPKENVLSYEDKTILLTEPYYRIYYFQNNLPKTENNASVDVLVECNS